MDKISIKQQGMLKILEHINMILAKEKTMRFVDISYKTGIDQHHWRKLINAGIVTRKGGTTSSPIYEWTSIKPNIYMATKLLEPGGVDKDDIENHNTTRNDIKTNFIIDNHNLCLRALRSKDHLTSESRELIELAYISGIYSRNTVPYDVFNLLKKFMDDNALWDKEEKDSNDDKNYEYFRLEYKEKSGSWHLVLPSNHHYKNHENMFGWKTIADHVHNNVAIKFIETMDDKYSLLTGSTYPDTFTIKDEFKKFINNEIDLDKKINIALELSEHPYFGGPTGKVIPPTYEQIKAYCEERKNNVNPLKFIAHYESNGWMVGKNKMKDWKASVRYWESGAVNNGQSKQGLSSYTNQELIDEIKRRGGSGEIVFSQQIKF